MKLKNLSIKDKGIFNKFLGLGRHELSVYAFENIYIWKGLFDIDWSIIENSLCIFFKDKFGCFLYLAPLSAHRNPGLIKKIFEILNEFNKNKDISRIENIAEADISFYEDLGYTCRNKSYDYLCLRSDLAQLKGNKLKSQRASFNFFIKHYEFRYFPFSLKYRDECLGLYNFWAKERKIKNQDRIYQGMLADSRRSLKNALDNYSDLNFTGRLVRINKTIKAFTFGFKLNQNTFCILYEITDLSIKGLSQFVFSRFCSELEDYKYINIMDDSGLENLKKVKLSYHPAKLIPAYIVKKQGHPFSQS
ncbi:MAG: phosphatidylglycerol lysyltransferase domain-containing protein [Candidatus Omnitrophota bacterium]|nr:phosphatidylglycerol lysyltransferase domain-containing protein [Candidatus Omnitrophota bacterium]